MLGYYIDLALRSVKRNKVLSALMVLAIAVGIGASMTTLTVMHVLSGDPLPTRSGTLFYPQVDPSPSPDPGHDHHPFDKLDYRSAMDLWSAKRADRQALVANGSLRLTAPGTKSPPLIAQVLSTTADFFPMFDVPFHYGSPWRAQDDDQRARVAVISADLNAKLFASANSVGRTLHLKDTDVRIIGVLAPWRPSPQFYDVAGGRFSEGKTANLYARPQDVFMPLSSSLEVNNSGIYRSPAGAFPTRALRWKIHPASGWHYGYSSGPRRKWLGIGNSSPIMPRSRKCWGGSIIPITPECLA